MQEADLFLNFIKKLNSAAVPYMVTGSVASIFFGEPRLTNDVDVVIDLETSQVAQFLKHFPDKDYYCPPELVIKQEIKRRQRGHTSLIEL